MTDSATPQAVFEQLLQGIAAGRWAELAELYAEDAIVDMPLNVPHPHRIEGREAVREHFVRAAGRPVRIQPHNVRVHLTTDPEVIIAEFDYDITFEPTGAQITAANIQVLRIHNGQIVATRDYHDHLRFAAVAGRAQELAGTLS